MQLMPCLSCFPLEDIDLPGESACVDTISCAWCSEITRKKCVVSDHNCRSGSDSGACLTSNSSDNGSSGSGGKPGGSLTPLPECPSDSSPSQAAPTLHFYSSQEDFKYQTLKRREPQPPMGTSNNNNSSCSNANNTKEGKFSRF